MTEQLTLGHSILYYIANVTHATYKLMYFLLPMRPLLIFDAMLFSFFFFFKLKPKNSVQYQEGISAKLALGL